MSVSASNGEERWPGLCAYCGGVGPDTRDHVVPACLYPTRHSQVDRLTVPTHGRCNHPFSLDETAFKEAISTAGANKAAATVRQSVLRSFDRPQTRHRAQELLRRFIPVQQSDGTGHLIYPYRDARVVRITKKIVAGLAYHHGLFLALPEQRIIVTYGHQFADELLEEASYSGHREQDVFRYWAFLVDDDERDPTDRHSFWRLEFYERCTFDTWILKPSSS